jgi:CheY-like chemotaxis protein
VAESDADSADILRSHLNNLGFNVTMVSCGVDAVISARQHIPMIIFLAAQLRDVAGTDLILWLRANPTLSSVPIVAMHAVGEDAPPLSARGFNACLRKPTTGPKIAQAIREASLRVS